MFSKLALINSHKLVIHVMGFFGRFGISGQNYAEQVGLTHYYHVCYEGCLANFEIEEGEDATKLYPEVPYVRVKDYLKRYL